METPPTMDNKQDPDQPAQEDEYTRSSGKRKFRFKSSSRHRSDAPSSHSHRHHHSHSHRPSKRHKHKHAAKRSPSPDPANPSNLSADAAFRESLFDALGDDEGAAYWESVYGQPIHRYAVPSVPKGPNGELEQMSDEEYAAYVRSRMWERTREGMLEEQERLRAERARHRKRQDQSEAEARERMRFDRAMEESLRRGRERRAVKAWRAVWEEYQLAWEDVIRGVGAVAAGGGGKKRFRDLVFWPVESGKRRDVSREAVEEFMRRAPGSEAQTEDAPGGEDDSSDLLAVLKAERIRWHPDKIQHRYGALGIDETEMRSVTEVFQIIDQMWNETRAKQS
ncbi:uncharacterized protein ACLA_071050 [Aspergillus clavatus NRRL 1]|uniref:DnaJ domain protein n=1 Tax=Aspergillus clavatus (strain ATCC 1007 / CBS 513.65 / DSM 816 / NCTC 3887 / NRRL 1 / QM 1276 / 107) TaxID=344612 RepID=A1C6Q1_ASPCL|nr:uncharacterized protein ACLA_071050 [Aspergillus clavatus NRRL 1]EAW14072.1 conserved hypothetical protein [Aspergillus clavatus NRRL 1]